MKHYSRLLLSVFVAAGLAGLGAGSFVRFSGSNGAGTLRLNPEQTFPEQADWPVTGSDAEFDRPFVAPDENYTRREPVETPFEFQPEDQLVTEPEPWAERSPATAIPESVSDPAQDFASPAVVDETTDDFFVDDAATVDESMTDSPPESWSESTPNRPNPDAAVDSGVPARSAEKTLPAPTRLEAAPEMSVPPSAEREL